MNKKRSRITIIYKKWLLFIFNIFIQFLDNYQLIVYNKYIGGNNRRYKGVINMSNGYILNKGAVQIFLSELKYILDKKNSELIIIERNDKKERI